MKFDIQTNTIEKVGDIKSNNISIDTNNLDFIVTILSTNLYSKPIESFIRETVSNAWDSHVEAGNDDPVILELGENLEGKYYCKIKDFGVGLSPERFDTIYKNIGSSTKRQDNTMIGGFGIGRFSALAYSDIVHITSVYDGVATRYMMYKDGNKIAIDVLFEASTTEKNGVEVMLYLKGREDIYKFEDAIRTQLPHFENLHVVTSFTDYPQSAIQEDFLNFKTKKYNHFSVNTLRNSDIGICILLGKVRYPLRLGSLNKNYSNYISNYPIAINLNIGDLEVTPNREEILYSTKNIETIEKHLDLAIEEIDEIIQDFTYQDFDNVPAYIEKLNTGNYEAILLEHDDKKTVIKILKEKAHITLNGKNYNSKSFLRMHNNMNSESLFTYQYSFNGYTISYKPTNINTDWIKRNFSSIFISKVGELNSYSKTYIRTEFSTNNKYFINFDKDPLEYVKIMHAKLRIMSFNSGSIYDSNAKWDFDSKIFKVLVRYFIKNLGKIPTFTDASVPKSWIDDYKAEQTLKRKQRKTGKVTTGLMTYYKYRPSEISHNKVLAESTSIEFNKIESRFKKLTIYGDKDLYEDKLKSLYRISLFTQKFNVIGLAPSKVKLLADTENFINIEKFMDTDFRLIRDIGTAMYIMDNYPKLKDLANLGNIDKISIKLHTEIKSLMVFCQQFVNSNFLIAREDKELYEEIYQLCKDSNSYNVLIKSSIDNNKNLLDRAECLLLFSEPIPGYGTARKLPDNKINLAVDYILARKLFRPDFQAVLKLKKETIYNIIKDENIKA